MGPEFVRHPSWSSNRTVQSAMSMENQSGPLTGPLPSYDNTFSPRAGSLNAFSGPFSARNSTSSASSLPVVPAPQGPAQSQVPSSSGLALSSSGLCNQMSSQHGRGDVPVDWATSDNEVAAGHIGSGGSDRSTTGADTHTTDAPESAGMWSCEEFLGPQSVERSRPGHLSAQPSGSGQLSTQAPGQLPAMSGFRNHDKLHGLKCMDPLLDALPRDLTEMAQGIATD